jgi:hypothetical protein
LAGFTEEAGIAAAGAAVGAAVRAAASELSKSCGPLAAVLVLLVEGVVAASGMAAVAAAEDAGTPLSDVGVSLPAAAVVGVTGCVEMGARDWLHLPLVRRVPKVCSCPRGWETCCAA